MSVWMIRTVLRLLAQQLLPILQRGILLLGDGMEQTSKFQLMAALTLLLPLPGR